jgi:HEAT repeat protein
VTEHADAIARGLTDALSEHRDVIVAVLEDLDAAPTQLALGTIAPTTASDARTEAALQTIAQAIEPKITAQLTSDDPKVRALAVSVLAKLDGGAVRGAEAVIRALGDPADLVRAAAMNAVAALAVRRGSAPPVLIAALVRALGSPAWGDRTLAALALGRLSDKGDLNALVKAAGDPSGFVREAVAQALANSAGALDTVLALSRDDDPHVRAAAARSLGTFKDGRAVKRRAELVSDSDEAVRAAAGGT